MQEIKISESTLRHAIEDHGPIGVANDYPGKIVARKLNDDRVVIGFLEYDTDCGDPLADCDGMGRIYTSHRDDRESHGPMQEALGLDSEWNIDEGAVTAGLAKMRKVSQTLAKMLEAKDLREQYNELRRLRLIGEPFVQVLDAYEHSGIRYSISGEGMQCRFDTSRGAAVWVPDSEARKYCEERAQVLAFGRIVKLKTTYSVLFEPRGGVQENIGSFKEWHEASKALEAKVRQNELKPETMERKAIGMARAAEEAARDSLDEYNKWLAGDCYGIHVLTGRMVLDEDGDEHLKLDDNDDSCWGYIGMEYAQQALIEEVESKARHLEQKAAQAA